MISYLVFLLILYNRCDTVRCVESYISVIQQEHGQTSYRDDCMRETKSVGSSGVSCHKEFFEEVTEQNCEYCLKL